MASSSSDLKKLCQHCGASLTGEVAKDQVQSIHCTACQHFASEDRNPRTFGSREEFDQFSDCPATEWEDLPRKIQQVRRAWASDMFESSVALHLREEARGFSAPQWIQLIHAMVFLQHESQLSLEEVVVAIEGNNEVAKKNAMELFRFLLALASDVDGMDFLQAPINRVLVVIDSQSLAESSLLDPFEHWKPGDAPISVLDSWAEHVAMIVVESLRMSPRAMSMLDSEYVQGCLDILFLRSGEHLLKYDPESMQSFLRHLLFPVIRSLAKNTPSQTGVLPLSIKSQEWLLLFCCKVLRPQSPYRQIPTLSASMEVAWHNIFVVIPTLVKNVFRENPDAVTFELVSIAIEACKSEDRASLINAMKAGRDLGGLDHYLLRHHGPTDGTISTFLWGENSESMRPTSMRKMVSKIEVHETTFTSYRKSFAEVLCNYCNKQKLGTLSLRKCTCGITRYCNAECQSKHWEAHKELCKTRRRAMRSGDKSGA